MKLDDQFLDVTTDSCAVARLKEYNAFLIKSILITTSVLVIRTLKCFLEILYMINDYCVTGKSVICGSGFVWDLYHSRFG